MLASQLDLSQSRDKARPSPVSDRQGTLLSNSVLQLFHDKPSHVPHMVLDFDTRKSCLECVQQEQRRQESGGCNPRAEVAKSVSIASEARATWSMRSSLSPIKCNQMRRLALAILKKPVKIGSTRKP